ncbi:MAG: hypothetical protein KJ561_03030, partial [Nanoarchaeota archaeon]|nr:hypothetical protein [Nanoarchaeota archaeon]
LDYSWYEGEYESTFLGKCVELKEFEKDLVKAKKFAEGLIGKKIKDHDYLGRGYTVECLPEYYDQVIWFLINKLKYITCYMEDGIRYNILDDNGIMVRRLREKVEREDLK